MDADPNTSTITDLARRAERNLYGKYRATVYQNNDPKKRGRLRLYVPSIFGKEPTDWVTGVFPMASASSEACILVPEVGSHVLVEFVEGDKSSPVWCGAYFPEKPTAVGLPTGFDKEQGQLHFVRTRTGVELRVEEQLPKNDNSSEKPAADLLLKHPAGPEVTINRDGIVTVADGAGASITLDPKAKTVWAKGHGDNGGSLKMETASTRLSHGDVSLEISASGIKATAPLVALDGDSVTLGKGAASPVLDAQAFALIYDAHTNPAHGIPAPPLSPALGTAILKRVKGA